MDGSGRVHTWYDVEEGVSNVLLKRFFGLDCFWDWSH